MSIITTIHNIIEMTYRSKTSWTKHGRLLSKKKHPTKPKCWVTGWGPTVKTWYTRSRFHGVRLQQYKEWFQWLLHLCSHAQYSWSVVSKSWWRQHASVQDARTPGVDTVCELTPTPCSPVKSTLVSNIKNEVYGNKWEYSHLTVCIFKNGMANIKEKRKPGCHVWMYLNVTNSLSVAISSVENST